MAWRAIGAALALTILPFAAAGAVLESEPPHAKPAFSLDALDGGRLALADQPGRPVLVHFFATWCEACRDELAAIDALRTRAGDGLAILVIDVGEVDVRVRRFFADAPVGFPVLLDRDRAVSKAWGVELLPTSYLLDGALTVRFRAEGDVDWREPSVDEILARLRAKTNDDISGKENQ